MIEHTSASPKTTTTGTGQTPRPARPQHPTRHSPKSLDTRQNQANLSHVRCMRCPDTSQLRRTCTEGLLQSVAQTFAICATSFTPYSHRHNTIHTSLFIPSRHLQAIPSHTVAHEILSLSHRITCVTASVLQPTLNPSPRIAHTIAQYLQHRCTTRQKLQPSRNHLATIAYSANASCISTPLQPKHNNRNVP